MTVNSSPDDPRRYDDLLRLPRPASRRHPPMPMESRAAQFLPFAALAGYDSAILETARMTDHRIELDEDEKLMLSHKLQLLLDNIQSRPAVRITYFVADARKEGGMYRVVTGRVKKVDRFNRQIVLLDGTVIAVDDVYALGGALFKCIDERAE